MQIRSTLNGGLAEVDDEFGARLIADGGFEAVDAKPAKPARKPRSPKPKPAPAQEPTHEE